MTARHNDASPWPERDNELERWWNHREADGALLSTEEVGRHMGITKDSAVGRVHRLQLRDGGMQRFPPRPPVNRRIYGPALSRTDRKRQDREKRKGHIAALMASIKGSADAVRTNRMAEGRLAVALESPALLPPQPTPAPLPEPAPRLVRPSLPIPRHDALAPPVNLLPVFADRNTIYAWGAQRGICGGYLDLAAVNRKRAQHGLAPFMIEQPVGRRLGLSA